MSDLVKRLRECCGIETDDPECNCKEATARIEALEAALAAKDTEARAMVAAACLHVLERGWAIGVHGTALDDMRLEIPDDARASLDRIVQEAVEAEQEACAKRGYQWCAGDVENDPMASDLKAAIRGRT